MVNCFNPNVYRGWDIERMRLGSCCTWMATSPDFVMIEEEIHGQFVTARDRRELIDMIDAACERVRP